MTAGDTRTPRLIAYFSMEAGLHTDMPTYSGGLGVLAGDTMRAAADLGLPLVAVTLIYHKGHFRQHLDGSGNQSEEPRSWRPEDFLAPETVRVRLTLQERQVHLCVWRYDVRGVRGNTVPVYLLDADLPENAVEDRGLTDYLYGGDERYRLCQEALLGIGGVALLRELGYDDLQTYHINEGHAALLALALLEEEMARNGVTAPTEAEIAAVRSRCVFTTHTPIAAGHDQFPLALTEAVLGEERIRLLVGRPGLADETLNMTYLGLDFSRYVNGVSRQHSAVARAMYPEREVASITNGVDAATWTSPAFQELYDRHFPDWRRDNLYLRHAITLPREQVRQAHASAKADLLAAVERRSGRRLNRSLFTIGFARRAAAYKRGDLFTSDVESLRTLAREVGPIQVVYAGKAHPRDDAGKAIIRNVFAASEQLGDDVPIVYLEEHDMALGRLLCAGVDLWLNTPQKPMEASGTSGMKAALNGVPSLSVLDGWWVEGWVDGVTGWAIGDGIEGGDTPTSERTSIYNKLAYVILPMFYDRPDAYAAIQRATIAINGAYFNAQRMVLQYLNDAYALPGFSRAYDSEQATTPEAAS